MSSPQETEQKIPIFRPVSFNFQDIREKADTYLANVRAEAARIAMETKNEIARLKNEVSTELDATRKACDEKARQQLIKEEELTKKESDLVKLKKEIEQTQFQEAHDQGKKEGYDTGFKEGYAAGEQQALVDYEEKLHNESRQIMAEQLETVMPAVQEAVKQLQMSKASFLLRWEQQTIQVATAIANQTISRELPNMIDVSLKLLKEALELAVGSVRLRIRMNPQDVEYLRPEIERLIQEITPAAESEVVEDMRILPGGCFLETSQGTIDQRIQSRLSRIEEELSQ